MRPYVFLYNRLEIYYEISLNHHEYFSLRNKDFNIYEIILNKNLIFSMIYNNNIINLNAVFIKCKIFLLNYFTLSKNFFYIS